MTEAVFILNNSVLGAGVTFILGLIFGSLGNVCTFRLPEDKSIVTPRSSCRTCQHPIPWFFNIPILSFLLLKGKCHYCKKPISFQYPLVELTCGLLFTVNYLVFGWEMRLLAYSLFTWLLFVISIIDLYHRIIPDELSLSGIVLGLFCCFVTKDVLWWESLLGIGLGGGIFFAVAFGYEKLAKREGLGGGDIKMLAMIGAWFGYQSILIIIILSTGLGSLVGISFMLLKRKDLKTAIPFGPFLAIASALYLYWGQELLILFFPSLH